MASTMSAKNKRDFDPKNFLATIGEGRKVVAFLRNKPSSRRGTRLTLFSISRKARYDSPSYPRLVRKRLWGY